SESAAIAAGVNVTLYKLWAFALASFMTGVAGCLLAASAGGLTTYAFPAQDSITLLAVVLMVVLAQAIVSHPSTLLVDELSLGLAPVVLKRLVPVLSALAASGVGVLLIEQFAHVALGLAQSAYILEGGRLRYSGSAQQLRENPELLRSAYLLRDHSTS
ncbi:MAG TPA: hypothetical protein VGL99_20240, partial [Chloroflexota bacterium]